MARTYRNAQRSLADIADAAEKYLYYLCNHIVTTLGGRKFASCPDAGFRVAVVVRGLRFAHPRLSASPRLGFASSTDAKAAAICNISRRKHVRTGREPGGASRRDLARGKRQRNPGTLDTPPSCVRTGRELPLC